MSLVFPAASWGQDYGAAAVPFQLRAFHTTPSFRRLLLDEQGFVQGWLNMDAEGAAAGTAPLRVRRDLADPLRHDARRGLPAHPGHARRRVRARAPLPDPA